MNLQDHFDHDGYVHVPGFMDTDEASECLRRIDGYIDRVVPNLPAKHVFYEDMADPSSLKQLQQIHTHDPWFKGLFGGKPKRLAEELLGTDVVGRNMQYFNKPPGTGQVTPAHQDGYYFKLDPLLALTMWLALDDVDEENGCVRYVKGSHLDGMRPHVVTETLGFSQGVTDFGNEQDLAGEVAITASPGDLIAHHALTIHRAERNRSPDRPRRALGFIFYSVDAKEDPDAIEKYRKEVNEQQQGRL